MRCKEDDGKHKPTKYVECTHEGQDIENVRYRPHKRSHIEVAPDVHRAYPAEFGLTLPRLFRSHLTNQVSFIILICTGFACSFSHTDSFLRYFVRWCVIDSGCTVITRINLFRVGAAEPAVHQLFESDTLYENRSPSPLRIIDAQ